MTQMSHGELSPNVSRYNESLSLPWVRGPLDLGDQQSLAAIQASGAPSVHDPATSIRSGPFPPLPWWCCR